MNLDFSSLKLAFLNFQPWMIGVVIPVAGLIFAGVIAVCGMHFHNRRREMWHQTARLALEKGQPLPPMPHESGEPAKPQEETSNDLRGGLVLIATGVGLYLFLGEFINRSLGYVGAIPGFIGVALLISGVVRLLAGRKGSAESNRSRES